jgi:hypothetical protein
MTSRCLDLASCNTHGRSSDVLCAYTSCDQSHETAHTDKPCMQGSGNNQYVPPRHVECTYSQSPRARPGHARTTCTHSLGPQCMSPARQATLMHCWEAAHSVKCGRTPSEDRSARTPADEKRYSLLSRCTDERESIGYLGQLPARSPCSDATQRHEHSNVGMCASVRLSDARPSILGCRAFLQP